MKIPKKTWNNYFRISKLKEHLWIELHWVTNMSAKKKTQPWQQSLLNIITAIREDVRVRVCFKVIFSLARVYTCVFYRALNNAWQCNAFNSTAPSPHTCVFSTHDKCSQIHAFYSHALFNARKTTHAWTLPLLMHQRIRKEKYKNCQINWIKLSEISYLIWMV